MARLLLVSASAGLLAASVQAAEVSREVELNAPADEVWGGVGEFCAIADWHPGVATCSEEEIDGATHRRLVGGDGSEFLERREDVAGEDHAYGYEIIESPLPVADYHSKFMVREAGDGSVLTWSVEFEPEGASEEEAVEIITGIFDAGLEQIASQYGGG